MAVSGRVEQPRPIYYFDIVHDYPAIGGVAEFSRILHAQLQSRYGARLVAAHDALARFGLTDPGGPYLERERRIARTLAQHDPDAIFFFPNFQSPIRPPLSGARPTVINVAHDVQFAHLPELFSEQQLCWLHEAFALARDNADEIVFVSRTTRDQFVRLFGAPRRSRVIYNPVLTGTGRQPDGLALQSGSVPPAGSVRSAAQAPFLLAVSHSDHHPHKNIAGLLALFAQLAARQPALRLYVTGHGRETFLQVLQAHLPGAYRARVRHLGYVPRAELNRLYARALAYVSLSHFEGFNMPAAEAASHGTPLILSDLVVHRELHGGRACLVDPRAPDADAVTGFLQRVGQPGEQARQRGAAWPYRQACAVRNVGAAYAAVLDAHGAWRLRDASAGNTLGGCARRVAGPCPHRLAEVVREAVVAGAMLSAAAALVAPSFALAGGGAGGDSGLAAGGAGAGLGQPGSAGEAPDIGSYYAGGGGGGGADGGAGGDAGQTNFAVAGDGGAGGVHGVHNASIDNTSPLTGGAGQDGGDGTGGVGFAGAAGGGGGAGGYGAVISGVAASSNSNGITGGEEGGAVRSLRFCTAPATAAGAAMVAWACSSPRGEPASSMPGRASSAGVAAALVGRRCSLSAAPAVLAARVLPART